MPLPRKLQELWEGVEFPHPFFGSMNLYEWPCWIILEHEREHHPQIREIVRKLGTR